MGHLLFVVYSILYGAFVLLNAFRPEALDAKFGSRGIKLAAALSTLAVSIFYLIPQM